MGERIEKNGKIEVHSNGNILPLFTIDLKIFLQQQLAIIANSSTFLR
jgi:hypothetical protein